MTDRTDDFRLIASALPPPSGVSASPKPKAPPRAGDAVHKVSTLGEFHSAAASTAKSIHRVSQKLGRLTKLVQQRGLFNDPATEINTLVHDIKQDMQALNSELDASQIYVDRRKREAGGKSQSANHTVNVVGQLKTELMDTAKTFKTVLQQRSENLKAQKDHREMFVGSRSQTLALAPPPAYRPLGISPVKQASANGEGTSRRGAHLGGIANGGTGGATGAGGSAPSSLPRPGQVTSYPDAEQEASADTPLIGTQVQQQQQQQQQQRQTQMQLATGNESYLESRSEAVQEVEGHIAELGLIFNKLATMLQDQREMVESIHDNVDDAGATVERGHLALLSTMRSLSSNRRLALSVVGILTLFMLIFFVFLV